LLFGGEMGDIKRSHPFSQQTALGGFAAAVQSFEYDELPPVRHFQAYLLHTA
jgi:hypothetical protein